MAQEAVIRFEHVSKSFTSKKLNVNAVRNVSLEIQKGEIFGIIGFSGAGKSTLIRCMNLLERPTDGNVFFQGVNLCEVNNRQLREARQKMGMIFQQFNLLEQRNVWENICYPLEIAGVKKGERKARIKELLELVDLTEKAKAYPSQLSGGQKQRVAIARALATNPEVILCDEATSALDPITTKSILDLLKKINQTRGVTIVVITHEMKVAQQICDRVGVMNQGELVELGRVREIFLHPQSETAKKMILSGGGIQPMDLPQRCLRIAFDGFSSSEPVISQLTLYTGEMINILGANTEDVGGKAYGQMIIEKPRDPEALRKIESFLEERGIHYEEGGGDV
ncbi:MAG: ATP-binding cassette domain-containing protein [Lachnospiraceae bacterium]|nr:ATP-binding cassette domain-containing protein [Lachnospiraceae bacterium]